MGLYKPDTRRGGAVQPRRAAIEALDAAEAALTAARSHLASGSLERMAEAAHSAHGHTGRLMSAASDLLLGVTRTGDLLHPTGEDS